MIEPIIHSHITDELPEGHPLAYDQVECLDCGVLVHAGNNECMQTWIETGMGNFCTECFFKRDVAVLDGEWALPRSRSDAEEA